ncbi:hypothetical protein MKW98_027126 [Papaver atlanticum]|uniref:DUF3741 domain-containing protein n=1 Tax=Papaver atlanticum TaxID=357466 RepID=A0AAD4SIX6_9MAGN|nr:hypothetical protein MKW98_027126 [Papaver atlanticum]
MKIFFSLSSSPSTSSTSNSSDTNLSNSQNVTTKCFSSIIRRFLGVGGFRTHPFDCIKEPNQVQHDDDEFTLLDEKKKIEAAPTPGLVARLMGLETMPELELTMPEKKKNPESIGRSRSTNSVDFSAKVDRNHRQHRRVKSSLSFLEMPECFELENDEFLLLTFENDEEEHKERVKCDVNKNERLQRRIKIRNDLGLVHPLKEISDNNGSKLAKARNRKSSLQKNVDELLPELENWSPNSVLNLDEFQLDNDSSSVSEEEVKERNSNSRRKLSTDIASSDSTSQHFPVTDVLESRTNVSVELTKAEFSANGNCKEMWQQVCKLTEDDMKTTSWLLKKQVQRMEEWVEIAAEFGQEIFDRLLQEIVIEVGEITDFAVS